ncbi:protein kinase [Erwinia amylovora]|uniref:protein kinase n=1 Tax=Erwinia amylovora TaxID=552 RepID=UPI0014444FAE|nr:protein kinase [Erwinia amylovora]
MVNYDKENCEPFQKYFAYYTVEQMAMLWCGIESNDFSEVIGECEYPRRAIPQHPYISCLEFRAAAIMDAIEAKELAVGRDGRCHTISDDHVAPERRTVLLKDFKEWLIKAFPSEKPKLIFDDIERNTHSSITVDVYQTLLADRDHLQVRINKAEEVFKKQRQEIESLRGENSSLKQMVGDGLGNIDARSERAYLNVIGGLLSIMLAESPGGKKNSLFHNQAAVISALLGHHEGKYGISATNLEKKFADANRSIRE